MKKLLQKQALAVRSSREGLVTVNLTTGERKPYEGKESPGTLYFRANRFRSPRTVGDETNVSHLSSLQQMLHRDFTDRQKNAGVKLAATPLKDTAAHLRRDLRDLPTITIDGPDSRDLDDAISARSEEDGFRLWVHIADVAAQLPKSHSLARRAARQTTSLYWPDRSLPMLPRELSESRFSLLPGQDRFALTVEVFMRDGAVETCEVYPSHIRSNARFSYDEVNEFLSGTLTVAEDLAGILTHAAAAVQLDSSFTEESRERYYTVENGLVTDYTQAVQGPSNKLIERLMVMANVQMGLFLRRNGRPALYRSHRLVDPVKAEKALAQVRTFIELPEDCSLDQARAIVEASTHPKKAILTRMLEWVTPPAQYQVEPEGHEGLAEQIYAHFTSPIRRLADLLNHRAIHAILAGKRSPYSTRTLRRLAARINQKNWEAKRLSRLMDDRFLTSHLAYVKDQGEYRGKTPATIEVFLPHGAFCSFGHGKQGFLYLDQLGPGDLNEELTRFTGKFRTVELGDTVQVSVGRPDQARGRVSLRLWRDRSPRRNSNSSSRGKSSSSARA